MVNAHDKLGLIQQNLADAGCDVTLTQQVLASFNAGDHARSQLLLQQHRQQLLQELRQTESRLDCLDFLACQLKNKKESD